jgi:hypothetical protein
VWLFPTEDMNPRGLDIRPLLAAVQQRYAFQKSPPSAEDFPGSGGLEFGAGGFGFNDELIAVVALKIFSDGLIAETKHSTDASDAVLQDAIAFAVERFGWSFDEAMVNTKAYFSEIVVNADVDIGGAGDKLQKIAALLSERSPETPVVPVGLRFGVNPASPGGIRVPLFVVERRANVPFEENRYFSQAPATTERHLHLLEEIEKILAV